MSEYPFVLIFPGLSLMGGGGEGRGDEASGLCVVGKGKGYPYPPPRLEGKSPKKELSLHNLTSSLAFLSFWVGGVSLPPFLGGGVGTLPSNACPLFFFVA